MTLQTFWKFLLGGSEAQLSLLCLNSNQLSTNVIRYILNPFGLVMAYGDIDLGQYGLM